MTVEAEAADPLVLYIGARLRTLREEARLAQSQLARALGVTFQQVQKYERGVNRVSGASLARTAEALGVTVMEFYPSDGERPSRPQHADELVVLFDRMNPRQREAFLTMARVVAG